MHSFRSASWIVLSLLASQLAAESTPSGVVEVTATRFPEDPAKVPASITVYSAQDLAARGVTDLRGALSLAAGVYVAPGGDAGPAASVPEFWGLKEFDAFLLVVDGVPWGGAFNPSLATLSLEGVERIEVQRGAAPVMYGATSFVGVIQIIRRPPQDAEGAARLSIGTHGTTGVAVAMRLPSGNGHASSLIVDHDKQGFADTRTGFSRTHLLWQDRFQALGGAFRVDLDYTAVNQQPASPFPRVGKVLTTLVPVDANHNPGGAHLDERRGAFTVGYDRAVNPDLLWSSTLSHARSEQDVLRGFLTDVSTGSPNAHGFRESINLNDIYLDSHLTWTPAKALKVVTGFDWLHGQGIGRGGDFDYTVALNGVGAPGGASLPSQADIRVDDRRDFTGLYAFAQWQTTDRLVWEAGLRLTSAQETRRTSTRELTATVAEVGQDARTTTRLTSSAGVVWTAWREGEDRLNLFAGLRNTFKPAAVDFGLDSEAQILKPETATSRDLGMKAELFQRRLELEVSAFMMDFQNLVVPQTVNGSPVLANAGNERFKGVELGARWRFVRDLSARLAYSYHDARFTDYAKDFGDGALTQLAGKRLEMSPYHLGALGLTYAPPRGFTAHAELAFTGAVMLNQRNTAPIGGYSTMSAGLGWREKAWDLRLSGTNLTDRRKPISESELGDAQYYLLPGRQVTATLRCRF